MVTNAIDCVVTDVDFPEVHWERIAQALEPTRVIRVAARDSDALRAGLGQADVAILKPGVRDDDLLGSNLRWVHIDQSGLESLATPELLARGPKITGSAGRSAPTLAEHALFFMLALAYCAPDFLEAQKARRWGIAGQETLRGLYGRTVGIVGLGHTGRALATRAKPLGMRVLGYRRSEDAPSGVDTLYSAIRGETIRPLLSQSDFVVLALPLSDRTHRLIGKAELAAMKPGAYLVNVARGAIVDEDALIASLRAGHLGGAGLDVFEHEPLPPDSRLWSAPNTLITPHLTPQMPDRIGQSVDIIVENINRYRRGDPLLNLLTPDDVFTGNAAGGRSP